MLNNSKQPYKPILPIAKYRGPLCPLLDNFLRSLQDSLNVIAKGIQQAWTMPEVNEKLMQLDDPEIDDMYGTYLNRRHVRHLPQSTTCMALTSID